MSTFLEICGILWLVSVGAGGLWVGLCALTDWWKSRQAGKVYLKKMRVSLTPAQWHKYREMESARQSRRNSIIGIGRAPGEARDV